MFISLYQRLQADGLLRAFFGERMYHEWPPQGEKTWPLLVMTLTSGQEFAPDMEDDDADELNQNNYQFDVYARTSEEVIEAAAAFHSVFKNLRGTIGAVKIQQVDQSNMQHLGEIVGDKQVRRVSLDYAVYFNFLEG